MNAPKQRVRDRREWPEGTIAAFDHGAPFFRYDGVWVREGASRTDDEIPGAVVLRVGDTS